MWDHHQIHPFGAGVLIGTPPNVYTLRGTARRSSSLLAHRLMFTPFGEQREGNGASVLTGTPPHVYTLRVTARRPLSLLAHCLMSTPFGEQQEGTASYLHPSGNNEKVGVLTGTPPHVYTLRGTARRPVSLLTHRLMSTPFGEQREG